jgi:metal-responsive CopG/Arc/MetJ family transcriptional regulator
MSDITDTTARIPIALRLPEDLLPGVDERAKALGISRNQWFENMTRWVLDNTVTIQEHDAKKRR